MTILLCLALLTGAPKIKPNAAQYRTVKKTPVQVLTSAQITALEACLASQWPMMISGLTIQTLTCERNLADDPVPDPTCTAIYEGTLTDEQYADMRLAERIVRPKKSVFNKPGGVWAIDAKVCYMGFVLAGSAQETCWENLILDTTSKTYSNVSKWTLKTPNGIYRFRVHAAETIPTDDLMECLQEEEEDCPEILSPQ